MFPKADLLTTNANTLSQGASLGKVFLFDFNKRQYVLQDGKPVEASYEQAISQWVIKLLITELDQYPVYRKTNFGLRFKHFIGRRDLPIGVINSELKRQIEEKLKLHPQITGVTDFSFTREGGKGKMSFTVQTLRGVIEITESEVALDGRYY